MSRFKFGLVIGFTVGWLVATGKATELLDKARERATAARRQQSAPADANGVYDFAVRAAQ